MRDRKSYEELEHRWLAPYAVKACESKGRRYPEKEHDYRTAFQRDKDRIIHSTAFRRLEYKTQVFVNHEGDHYRTRLTHSLEVAQIARSIARVLRINEDFVEVLSLAHDVGHGPFGHAGEKALAKMMKGHGGFDHNRQALRIIEELEESYAEFPGLNLTREVRRGLAKHQVSNYLEAQLADLADEIAYNSHDLDDGLRSGLLEEKGLEEVLLWRDIQHYIGKRYPMIGEMQRKRLSIRLLINLQVTDLIQESERRIKEAKLKSVSDCLKLRRRLVGFSKSFESRRVNLRGFLHKNLYQHYRVIRMTEKGERFIESIFRAYLKRPEQLPSHVQTKIAKYGLHRTICDYIAGMTDRFAQDEYKRLFEPYERV